LLNYNLIVNKSFHSSSSNSVKRLTNAERAEFNLDEYLKQVLIGNILGDVYMRKSSDKANVRIILDKVL
jgi:hypothetical protein